jgi:hypothetical protein
MCNVQKEIKVFLDFPPNGQKFNTSELTAQEQGSETSP